MQKLVWQNAIGDEINLTSEPFGITNWEGFSNADLNIQSQQVPFQDGGVFLDALIEQRELTVTLAMQDNNNLETRYQLRRNLIHILNPKLGEGYLIYTNDYTSKRIKCIPQIPLFENHNSNDSGTPKASLSWTACSPYWEDLEETEVSFQIGEMPVINNEGDIPAQMKIELIGSAVNPKIQNMTTEKEIEYQNQLQTPVLIDTNIGEKKVVTEELGFEINYFTGSPYYLTYINQLGLYFAIGGTGAILTSKEGINWKNIRSNTTRTLYGIAFSTSRKILVIVGDSGVILTSPDGINWTSQTSGTNSRLNSVCYSEELDLFVAVGNSGVILTSPDGINWTSQTSGVSSNINSIIYIDEQNLFYALGSFVFTSSDGVNWTQGSQEAGSKIFYLDNMNLYIIIGDNGKILTSSDGVNWTSQTSGTSYNLKDICYSKDRQLLVIVGNKSSVGLQGSGVILTSPDGVNWSNETINRMLNVSYFSEDLNQFLIMGLGCIKISNDGMTWNNIIDSTNRIIYSICYSKKLNIFLAVGTWGGILKSNDGINWIEIYNSETNYIIEDIMYSEELELFIAVDSSGRVLTSSDTLIWDFHNVGSGYFYSICYSKKLNLFVIVGSNGKIYTSSDGVNWTSQTSGVSSQLNSVCYSEKLEMFIIVGNSGVILTSPDGVNWTSQISGVSSHLRDIVYAGNLNIFIIVGSGSTVLTSTNGITWARNIISFTGSFYSIEYSEGYSLFVLCGDSGLVAISSDGIVWNQYQNIFSTNLKTIGYSQEKAIFILGGDNGYILNSELLPEQNVIQYISQESDMNLNLDVGENQFRLLRTSGTLRTRITYRQKYIGV